MSCDGCGRVFPDKLHVSLLLDRFPHYNWTAAQSANSNFVGSRVHACLGATCHLHFWQNDWGLLRATVVRWKVEQTLNRKFSCCSCQDLNSQPLDHESGALPTSYPGCYHRGHVDISSNLALAVLWLVLSRTFLTVSCDPHSLFSSPFQTCCYSTLDFIKATYTILHSHCHCTLDLSTDGYSVGTQCLHSISSLWAVTHAFHMPHSKQPKNKISWSFPMCKFKAMPCSFTWLWRGYRAKHVERIGPVLFHAVCSGS